MAPPSPHFVGLATPKENVQLDPALLETPRPPSWWSLTVHWVAGLLLAFSIFAATVHYTPVRDPVTTKVLNVWWDVNPKVKGSGRSEMVLYTYFFFGMVLPLLAAYLLVRLVTKGVAAPIPRVSHWLQRKPRFARSLVSYGELLFLAFAVVGNIIFFYYFYASRALTKTTTQGKIGVAAKTLGFSTLYNMLFLALPASKHCFWMEWLGIPYAHGVKYHRWLGVATVLCATLHTGFYVQVYGADNDWLGLLPCFDCDVGKEGKEHWVNTFGWLAFFCMAVMGVTSLPFVRRRSYNLFYVTHFLFVPATLFAIMHYGNIVAWLFATIVLYIANRMMSTASIQAPVVVLDAAAREADVTELVVAVAMPYNAGDVVYLKVPAVSKTQWHPFSVASSPLQAPGAMTIYIKSLGHWSRQVHAYIGQCTAAGVNPVVFMDGGYTSPAPVPSTYDKLLFVAGGIGATPLLGQIMHLLLDDTESKPEIHLVWHARDVRLLTQFHAWLHRAAALSSRLHVHLFVTQQPTLEMAASDTSAVSYDVKTPSPVAPRPYAKLSLPRQIAMMLLAFASAGGLLFAAHYTLPIQTIKASYWPLQRFVEFVAVVVGAYWAYVVVLIKPQTPKTAVASYSASAEPPVAVDAFVEQYEVQFRRADWDVVFQDVLRGVDSASWSPKVGVYVSGPKTLSRAIDAMAQTPVFAVHHEEFEM